MKYYNKPPTTLKSTCGVESNLAAIRKSLLLCINNKKQSIHNNSECKENLNDDKEDLSTLYLRNEIISCPKERLIREGGSTDAKKIIPQDNLLEKDCSCSLSPLKEDSNNRIYSPEVITKLKSNICSKKFSQGKYDSRQKEVNPVSTNKASKEELCNVINSNLFPVSITNGNRKQYNMLLRNRLNVQKLGNRKNLSCSTIQSDVSEECSLSPESVSVEKVIALIEPLPEDRGKCSKITQRTTKLGKNRTNKKKVVPIDFDAIESSVPSNKPCLRSNTKEINLPRTLIESNVNEYIGESKLSFFNGNENYFSVENQGDPLQTLSEQDKNRNEKNDKENYNQKGKREEKVRRSITKPKTKRKNIKRRKKPDSNDSAISVEKLRNVAVRSSRAQIYKQDFNCLVESINQNVVANTTAVNKSKAPKKRNRISKTVKNYHHDVMRQDPASNGYESLHSDNELFSTIKRTKRISTNKDVDEYLQPKKYVVRPISFKPIFTRKRKSQSSSSSVLPDLDIEIKTPPNPVEMKRFSDSDVLLESAEESVKPPPEINNAHEEHVPVVISTDPAAEVLASIPRQVADKDIECDNSLGDCHELDEFVLRGTVNENEEIVKISPKFKILSNICLKKPEENKNTHELCLPVSTNSTVVLASISEEIANKNIQSDNNLKELQQLTEYTNSDMEFTNLVLNEISMESRFNLSSSLPEVLSSEPSRVEINSWIATGLQNNGTTNEMNEIIKSFAEAVMSQHANSIRVLLQLFRRSTDPSLNDLYDSLRQQYHNINSYFNRE